MRTAKIYRVVRPNGPEQLDIPALFDRAGLPVPPLDLLVLMADQPGELPRVFWAPTIRWGCSGSSTFSAARSECTQV